MQDDRRVLGGPLDALLLVSKLNQIASPFLQLSAESRNSIYEHYFQQIKWLIHSEEDERHREHTLHVPSLLLVCRQIYTETALLPYSKSLLSANNLTLFAKWLATRSILQVNSITRLELQCSLALMDHSITHHTLPVDKHGTLLRSFPRLKYIHLQVDVTRRTRFGGPTHPNCAQTHVNDLRQSFEKIVPGVEVTAAHATEEET
ncbi:uncharacterized protein K460DRAFT_437447 [Cucurbitaria berberidis CBS 394.84]|uniref:Uncharacterized protein n=1 Tax=Cucurbitaria berberidis CBS 394.84 TaxID=1168544 RepID=A0A9P4L3I9_9PLEO|nr:uncharacterized protein K460DRAFT_437447 [Cucurbitaria berberidis CBS 394.84]KAF1840367.1 hypothetical protein K460DRAFT_437447 [Cucurbitaria berberidis CBS 394.84]